MNRDLKNIHFLDWTFDEKEELKDFILNEFEKLIPDFCEEYITDILVTGSRVIKIDDKSYFRENSDLDILVRVDTEIYKKYFDLSYTGLFFITQTIAEKLNIKINKEKEKNKLKPRIKVKFKDILLSIFIYADVYTNKEITHYYKKWHISYYSLINHYYDAGNIKEIYEYLINRKGRIEKQEFCFVCKQYKNTNGIFEIKFTPFEIENDKIIYKNLPVCKECLDALCLTENISNVILAFKKEPDINDTKLDKISAKLIKWWTKSKYYHVEICLFKKYWISALPEKGFFVKEYNPNKLLPNWDYYLLEIDDLTIKQKQKLIHFIFNLNNKHTKYDWKGIFTSQFVRLGIQNDNKYFCSELVVKILQMLYVNDFFDKYAYRYSPADIYNILKNKLIKINKNNIDSDKINFNK